MPTGSSETLSLAAADCHLLAISGHCRPGRSITPIPSPNVKDYQATRLWGSVDTPECEKDKQWQCSMVSIMEWKKCAGGKVSVGECEGLVGRLVGLINLDFVLRAMGNPVSQLSFSKIILTFVGKMGCLSEGRVNLKTMQVSEMRAAAGLG